MNVCMVTILSNENDIRIFQIDTILITISNYSSILINYYTNNSKACKCKFTKSLATLMTYRTKIVSWLLYLTYRMEHLEQHLHSVEATTTLSIESANTLIESNAENNISVSVSVVNHRHKQQ